MVTNIIEYCIRIHVYFELSPCHVQAWSSEPKDHAPIRDGSQEIEQELVHVRLGPRPV